MSRSRWSLAAFLAVLLALASSRAHAQTTDVPSTGHLQSVGTSDLGFRATDAQSWWTTWALSRFGSPSVYGWGRSTVRSGLGRSSNVVLRERRGLQR
jgi:hypothetical protein